MKILLILQSLCKWLEMINFTSSFRAKIFMVFDVLKDSSSTALQYLYNIYKASCLYVVFEVIFFQKKIIFFLWNTALQYLYNIYKASCLYAVFDVIFFKKKSYFFDEVLLYNIYINIYKLSVFAPFSKWFFLKNLWSNLHRK